MVIPSLLADLKALNLRDLQLGSASRKALRSTLDAAQYYLEIYNFSLDKVLSLCKLAPSEMTIVDFGGGHGLLSILAKRVGFGRVIYVDSDTEAFRTVGVLSQTLGSGPDVMIQGDARKLSEWCHKNAVCPNALLGMEVLDKIYVLDDFFGALHEVSTQMKMMFTTSATPFNNKVVRRLHKTMQKAEVGTATRKGYWQMRYNHIKSIHPDMSDREAEQWARDTRGLSYPDIDRAVEAQSPNLLLDPHNTCDPATGQWVSRILPVDDYRQLLTPYGFNLAVLPGRCNDHCRGLKAWRARRRNRRIDKAPTEEPKGFFQRRRMRKALEVAPFIYLIVS